VIDRRAEHRRAVASGMTAVAATYVFFLLFAQFGFLSLLRARLGPSAVEPALGAMGLAGLAASLATPLLLGRFASRTLLRAGFAGSGLAAGASAACGGLGAFTAVAALVGASCGLLTVSLAADLRAILGPRTGWKTGGATGLAYLFCNLPGVFDAAPQRQALLAAAVAVLGLVAVGGVRAERWPAGGRVPPRLLFHGAGFAGVLLSLFALIWLDSTAFGVIQATASLKTETWSGPTAILWVGAFHGLGALLAGSALDRGAFRSLLVAALVLFAIAIALLEQGGSTGLAGPLYAVAVSIYSVALVVFPSARADEPGLWPVRWRAAIAFGVCGWIGSAAGVGMAGGLKAVPAWLLWISAALVLGPGLMGTPARSLLRLHLLTLSGAGAALVFYAATSGAVAPHAAPDDAVARGRRVYIDEGCINCHSQYVRPVATDARWWGPAAPRDPASTPPLIGNRRQGPDLTTVGLRRDASWLRLHMIDPRLVSPGSKMPSYRHLFAGHDARGDDLVAYLASLGASELLERAHWAAGQPSGPGLASGDRRRGAALFAASCVACHGANGRGDGPLAQRFDRQWLDLHKDELWLVAAHPQQPEEEVLARLIRFGLIGGSMPGHEYWSDRELADVVAHVRSLRGRGDPPAARP
jgi:cytochrome c oxidase cbb3-type subunit 2